MSATTVSWTKSLDVSQLRADPSGVQDASTVFQALLLPGMSTVTTNVRYISLFAAARHYRMHAGQQVTQALPWREYVRRLEALIAVSSHRHHRGGTPPLGIVGAGAGQRMSSQERFELKTGLRLPPYNIFRGTMSALGIIDIATASDPLFEAAQPLAAAWTRACLQNVGSMRAWTDMN